MIELLRYEGVGERGGLTSMRPISEQAEIMNPGVSSALMRTAAPCMLSLALFVLLHVTATFSQVVGVDVTGNVTDPQGLALSGAKLMLRRLGDSVTQRATADDQGVFTFKAIPPGTYTLLAEASGFETASKEISVGPAQSTKTDIHFLRVSAGSQQVSVVATVPAALTPDPGQKIAIHDDVLDANPRATGCAYFNSRSAD